MSISSEINKIEKLFGEASVDGFIPEVIVDTEPMCDWRARGRVQAVKKSGGDFILHIPTFKSIRQHMQL